MHGRNPRAWFGLALVGGLLVAATGCFQAIPVSDTGYTGTWSRGNEHVHSIIAIARRGDDYLFRWNKLSDDGKLLVRCDWDGRCEELLSGKQVATYTFRTWLDSGTGHLMVEGREERYDPDRLSIHYVDELVVEPGGRVLWSYTNERDGQTFQGNARPKRSFKKVSDGVAGPSPAETKR